MSPFRKSGAVVRCVLFIGIGRIVSLIDGPTAASAQPPDADTSATAGSQSGFFDILFSGGWVGLTIVLFLFVLSLTAAYLIFEQLMELRRGELVPDGLSDKVRQSLTAGNVAHAQEICRTNPSLLSVLIQNGLAESDDGWAEVDRALEDSLSEQAARLFRKIEYLSVIGNIAPMVGLLGTVTGMIFAFQQVATTQGAAGAADLAEGIYQALVTTVGGLLVAIPSLGAFAIFRNRVDGLIAEAAHAAQHALLPLKRRRPTPPVPPTAGESRR